MPVDANGNITTTRSVNVKTLQDVITTDGKDVLPSLLGGMVRTPQNPGNGTGLELGAGTPYVLPAATTTVLGGVKKASTVAALAGGADLPTTVTAFNDLLAKLKTAGIIA